jgi:hypothetical protein
MRSKASLMQSQRETRHISLMLQSHVGLTLSYGSLMNRVSVVSWTLGGAPAGSHPTYKIQSIGLLTHAAPRQD